MTEATSAARFRVAEGSDAPLGVTAGPHDGPRGDAGDDAHGDAGINVAVWAPGATRIEFCLFEADEETRIELPFRTGDIWHAHIAGAGLGPGARYGLRAHGPYDPANGLRFNPAKLLLDPYARVVERKLRWDPLMSGCAGDDDLTPCDSDSAGVVPKCVIGDPEQEGPDPASNRPGHRLENLVIYEAHLKGMTAAHGGVPEELRGAYAGMGHRAVVEHLTSLGVNAVEFLPLQAFIDDRFLVSRDRTNYWGYQPLSYFAAEPRYASDGTGATADAELRSLVHTLHEAGIEVIVDVVYNHTGEGDHLGPTLSFRGLGNTGYYRLQENPQFHVNDTGTGNTLAVDRPMVLRLVLDSMRHWAEHFGVDGFRFDLAATLGRTAGGFTETAAFFQAVQQDPVLSRLKLIAEPWDIGPGGYQLGRFPHPWSEWNDQFRDGVRRAWRGDALGRAGIGDRLLGSAGAFDHSSRSATASINFLTAHDGFTLHDLVSYEHKHNEANGEDGLDGHSENYSSNLGVEGATDDASVLAARARRVRGMLGTLLVSQGVPMLLAGDELGNGQGGNNNAYTLDNELGWVDWSSPDWSLVSLVRSLIEMRRRHPSLRQAGFLHGTVREDGVPDVVWRRADGSIPSHEDWHDDSVRSMGVELRGAAPGRFADAVFVVLNPGDDVEVVLPVDEDGQHHWSPEIDTARFPEAAPAGRTYPVLAQSVVVFAGGPS